MGVTHGEHRFAPQRRSPAGAKPGTVQDRGLAIDRAWWRLRTGRPGQHYWDLRATLAPHIDRLAQIIDSGTNPSFHNVGDGYIGSDPQPPERAQRLQLEGRQRNSYLARSSARRRR